MKEPTIHNLQMNTTYGNLNAAVGRVEFEGEAAGAEGRLFKLPPMCKVVGLKLVNDALGASTTVKVDAVDKAGNRTAMLSPANTATAGRVDYDGAPVMLDVATTIAATTAGGAATGVIDVVLQYIYIGA
ncbi:hypothetical protein [Microbulbifer sp. TYP-18]|uniref:hypothetical protein n=1 Tax=Microbulbifer sp. TYP-18 TaxID=3230024 RepID=UPI0034C6A40C